VAEKKRGDIKRSLFVVDAIVLRKAGGLGLLKIEFQYTWFDDGR